MAVGDFEIRIKHYTNKAKDEFNIQQPIVEDGVKWETARQGSAGKLTFKVYKDKNGQLDFQEGDMVALRYYTDKLEWVELFVGFIFTKKRNKDGWIDVTAYDLLRYLKNKDTYVYTNLRADQVITMIAKDYKLPIGNIVTTNHTIGNRSEDNQSLFDIIQNALDLTLIHTNKLYVLYVQNNKLYLSDATTLKTDIVIHDEYAEDFEYTSTIDEDVYNDIEVYYDNSETNKREYAHPSTKVDFTNWGRLRLTEQVQNPSNMQERADQLLKLYNRKNRKVQIKSAIGDYRCKAGASVPVKLGLGDINVNNYMLIEKATHTFKYNEHRMDLTLSDKEFSA